MVMALASCFSHRAALNTVHSSWWPLVDAVLGMAEVAFFIQLMETTMMTRGVLISGH
jgi:hypothetical protein